MNKRILLIDDDQDLLRSFEIFLKNNNFDVSTATDGKKGFQKLISEKPDLMVLDIMMDTNFEGYNLLHQIKKEPDYRDLPIIVLTGMKDQMGVNLYSAVEDETFFPNVSFQDKPIDPLALIDLIKDMLKE